MTGHIYDHDLAFNWVSLGEAAGGRPTWVVDALVMDGGGLPAAVCSGSPVHCSAVLSDDGSTLRIRRLRYDRSGSQVEDVSEAERYDDEDFDDLMEDPVVTLRRWLRKQYRPMTVLVPRDWLGP